MDSGCVLVLCFLVVYSESVVSMKNLVSTDANSNATVASRTGGAEQNVKKRRDSKSTEVFSLDGYITLKRVERDEDNLTLNTNTQLTTLIPENTNTQSNTLIPENNNTQFDALIPENTNTQRNTLIPENYTFDTEPLQDIGNTAKIIKMRPDKVKEKNRKKPVDKNKDEEEEEEEDEYDDELIREIELATKKKSKPAAMSEAMIISKKMLTFNQMMMMMIMMILMMM